ncbi:MAG: phage tail fiber protein [Enterobacteriaceae bacterium]
MSGASTWTMNHILGSLLRGQTFPSPVRVYIALHTADPGTSGSNEVTLTLWPAYVRKDAAEGTAAENGFSEPSEGVSQNTLQLMYPVHNGAGNLTVSHWSLWDSDRGGNPLLFGTLETPRTVQPGDVFVIDTKRLTVRVS